MVCIIKAVIYTRYSSNNQREESIEGQIRVCTEYAQKKGYSVINVYADRAMTGTNDHRPEFQKMIKDCEKHSFDVVIVYKTDRFSRNRYDSAIYKAKLKKNNVCIEYAAEPIPDDSTGIILEGMLESMAEWYSVNLSQNTMRGKKENALKGKMNGGVVPLGYRKENGNLVIDTDTAQAVRFIFNSYVDNVSFADIVKQLRDRYGIVRKTSGLKTLLQNNVYTGTYSYTTNEGEYFEYPENHEAIIDKSLFIQAEQKRLKNKRSPHAGKGKKKYMLAGYVRCGLCGAPYVISHSYRNGIPMYYRLYCLNRKENKSCNNMTRKMDLIESIVIQAIKENVLNKETIHTLAVQAFELQERTGVGNIQELKKELSNIQKAKNNLLFAIEQGIITPTTKNRLCELEAAESDLQIRILNETPAKLDILTVQQIESFLSEYCNGDFDDYTFCYELIRTFVKDIVIYTNYVEVIIQIGQIVIQKKYNL